MSASRIGVKAFSSMPELAQDGWDPGACSEADYGTARAMALYSALGVDPGDDRYALAANGGGRWALIGLTPEGHQYAEEVS